MCLGAVMAGVKAMAKSDGSATNHDVFWEAFTKATGFDAEEMKTLFSRYEGPFSQVGEGVQANPEAARAVETLKNKGYRVAVTTMPMFPLAAVHERIRWAGLDPDDFEFATDYETCYAVKPMPASTKIAWRAQALRPTRCSWWATITAKTAWRPRWAATSIS